MLAYAATGTAMGETRPAIKHSWLQREINHGVPISFEEFTKCNFPTRGAGQKARQWVSLKIVASFPD